MSTAIPGPDESTPQPPASPRRGMNGTAKSMILSMIAVIAAVLVWLAIVPRTNSVAHPVVDAPGIAREIGIQQKWTPALPKGLPAGWGATNVRLLSFERQPKTWQAGYSAPQAGYVAVLQTKAGDQNWVTAQVGNGTKLAPVVVAGVQWTKYENTDRHQRSLVRSAQLGGLDTVVTGTGSWDQLQQFAAALQPTAN